MGIKQFSKIHPSMIYPRRLVGHRSRPVICPACRSNKIKSVVLELEFRRQSICISCGTLWTTRDARIPIRYKQEFYK